ncbi:Oxygen-independent coproporphyrinogen-III oxidase-like protein [Halioglobus japonicus]|nr:Oxygen-independent coproporphyrinogen-III oxidase-like protein [Halioglobus japonicus]
MPLPPLGLYIHLPWCERKCPYCDFNSHESSHIPQTQYIHALLQDLQDDLHFLQGRAIETLFIGGGTPSLFSGSAIKQLLQGIAERVPFAPTLEATMEANPGSAEADKFAAFRDAGITRLSIGIQSFNDTHLQALGRIHTSDQAHAAIEYARSANFDSFNLDLMHGLPGQTALAAEADLLAAIACKPAHLSWYQLTIEQNTVFHKRPPLLPVEDELADIQEGGEQLLASNGYAQYEVSAYSKPGFNCRHNTNYWSFGDYLGIGAGAHGKITNTDGSIQRFAKRRQPQDYMAAEPGNFISTGRTLEQGELTGEFMMNALRLNDGFTLSRFVSATGLDASVLTPQLELLQQRGLLNCERDIVKTTDLGRRFLDSVVAEFFADAL